MFTQCKSGRVRNTLAVVVSIFLHAGTPAHAADVASQLAGETGKISRTVDTADLNLAVPTDQAILHQRIATAARRICRDLMTDEDLAGYERASCVQAAEANGWAAAQPKIAAAQQRSVVASVRP